MRERAMRGLLVLLSVSSLTWILHRVVIDFAIRRMMQFDLTPPAWPRHVLDVLILHSLTRPLSERFGHEVVLAVNGLVWALAIGALVAWLAIRSNRGRA